MENNSSSSKLVVVKNFYFYLVSFAALMMMVISTATIITNVLKLTVFPKADNWYMGVISVPGCDGYNYPGQPTSTPEQCVKKEQDAKVREEQNRQSRMQSSLVWSISVLVVAVPLFIFHWRVIKRKETAV
jgi:hypothetical protein